MKKDVTEKIKKNEESKIIFLVLLWKYKKREYEVVRRSYPYLTLRTWINISIPDPNTNSKIMKNLSI